MAQKYDVNGVPIVNFDVEQTLASPGSAEMPGGLILKFGSSGSIANGSTETVTFATAFPNGVLSIQITATNTGGTSQACDVVTSGSVTGFIINNAGSVARTFYWLAIGY